MKRVLIALALIAGLLFVGVQAVANHASDSEHSSITPPPAQTPPTDLIPVDEDDVPSSGTRGFTVRSNTAPTETVPPMATVPPKPTMPPPVDGG